MIIIMFLKAVNQYIRMISEGSRDTEDCSNNAENSALITGINYILQYTRIETGIWNCNNCNNILQNNLFYDIFDQKNAALVSIKYLLQKHKMAS